MKTLDPALVYALAARAQCHHRTARDYLLGRDVRGAMLRYRLAVGARDLGAERLTASSLESQKPPRAA